MMAFGNEIVVDIISKEEVIVEQCGSLTLYDWCPYKTGEFGQIQTHIEERQHEDTQGGDGCVGAEECQRLSEAGREAWHRFSLEPLEGAQPC